MTFVTNYDFERFRKFHKIMSRLATKITRPFEKAMT